MIATSTRRRSASPARAERLGERLLHTDTRWTLDLDDPCRWRGGRLDDVRVQT